MNKNGEKRRLSTLIFSCYAYFAAGSTQFCTPAVFLFGTKSPRGTHFFVGMGVLDHPFVDGRPRPSITQCAMVNKHNLKALPGQLGTHGRSGDTHGRSGTHTDGRGRPSLQFIENPRGFISTKKAIPRIFTKILPVF